MITKVYNNDKTKELIASGSLMLENDNSFYIDVVSRFTGKVIITLEVTLCYVGNCNEALVTTWYTCGKVVKITLNYCHNVSSIQYFGKNAFAINNATYSFAFDTIYYNNGFKTIHYNIWKHLT